MPLFSSSDSELLDSPPPPPQFDFHLLLFLNVVSCFMVIIGAAIKGAKEYRLTPLYSLLTFFAAIFLTIAFLYDNTFHYDVK
jgi:hypothetical protein